MGVAGDLDLIAEAISRVRTRNTRPRDLTQSSRHGQRSGSAPCGRTSGFEAAPRACGLGSPGRLITKADRKATVTAAHATARQTGTAITLKRDEINALLETGYWARFQGCRIGASTQRALRCVRQSGRRLPYSRLADRGPRVFGPEGPQRSPLQFPKASPRASQGHAAVPGL
jgi:hypothetical protein